MEYKYRLDGILQMLISSGRPVTMVDDADYRESMRRLDPKFTMPASGKMNSLLKDKWERAKEHLKNLLAGSRKVVICLDGWSKKGLSSHYLGISACFFDPSAGDVKHIVLQLAVIRHPHTGEKLAVALNDCLIDWGLGVDKILMIVSDNGANMIKAIKLLKEMNEDEIDECSDDDEEEKTETEMENKNEDLMELPREVRYLRMRCMAHTLQLVIKKCYVQHYDQVLSKARRLVKKLRKSSDAVQKLLTKCGRNLITDNSTRWNSTYYMVNRLLDVKLCANEILADMRIDSLTVAEWSKLEEIKNLLKPFATHTDILQTDALSLSYVIPSVLDLDCHLQQFSGANSVTNDMRADLRQRFAPLLEPVSHNFNPLPAAACFLDPNVGTLLLAPHMRSLLDAAKLFITAQSSQCERNSPAPQSSSETETATTGAEPKPQFTRFLFLSKSAYVQPPAEGLAAQSGVGDSIVSELSKYVVELESIRHRRGPEVKPLIFWKDRQAVFPNLRLIAEDLVAAPASQAYVERIFSVCGLLTNGNRNRMSKSLEMRVCLKLNNNTLKHSGHNQF